MNKKIIIKYIIFSVTLFLIGGSVAYIINYSNSFTQLTIHSKTPNKVSLFSAISTDSVTGYTYNDKSTPILSFTGTSTVKIKKAPYVIVVDDPDGVYDDTKTDIFPRTSEYSITINPGFTSRKLTSLLPNELSDIELAINKQVYNFKQSGYTIKATTLYQQGDWAGAILIPNSNNKDIYRVVLKKESNDWKVVTNPPQIIIGSPSYPNIPKDVLTSVNNDLKLIK